MTMATMEEMGVQNNDEGPPEQKNPCSVNYTAMEDVMVTMAFFKALEDLIVVPNRKDTLSDPKLNWHTIQSRNNKKKRSTRPFATFSFGGNGHCGYALPC